MISVHLHMSATYTLTKHICFWKLNCSFRTELLNISFKKIHISSEWEAAIHKTLNSKLNWVLFHSSRTFYSQTFPFYQNVSHRNHRVTALTLNWSKEYYWAWLYLSFFLFYSNILCTNYMTLQFMFFVNEVCYSPAAVWINGSEKNIRLESAVIHLVQPVENQPTCVACCCCFRI